MTEPPFPEAIVRRVWGHVPGLCRQLNKRSFARGCAKTASSLPDETHHPEFISATHYASLAFGTAPGNGLTGEVLVYAGTAREAVIAELNRREGWDSQRPMDTCGYLKTMLDVHTDQGILPSVSYISNPKGIHHIVGLSPHDIAAILVRATPNVPTPRACGIRYVTTVAQWLNQAGSPDTALEHLVQVMQKNRKDDEK